MTNDTTSKTVSVSQTSLLLAGTTIAALTEAIAGTVLTFARFDIMGDAGASPDDFAAMDYGYTAAKLVAFVMTVWLARKLTLKTTLMVATLAMSVAAGLAAFTADLTALFVLRLLQGFAGGAILVSGQALLLRSFPKSSQAFVQSTFALAAVVAPATLVPYMQGWIRDTFSWGWIFLAIVPIGMISLLLLWTFPSEEEDAGSTEIYWPSLGFFVAAAFALSFVLNQGNRWDWFEEAMIVKATVAGTVAMIIVLAWQFSGRRDRKLFDFSVFLNGGFSFGFLASFAAGFALLGSSYLIPSFAISVLKMTPTQAGLLLLPSTIAFMATLFLTAALIRFVKLPPVVTVPLGIIGFMIAMWMLTGSTSESGISDMLPAILVRGFALGFLFLSITLISMLGIAKGHETAAVGLFNMGRQVGGLFGIAFLQTLVEDETARSRAILAASVIPGRQEVTSRLAQTTHYLSTHGLDALSAGKASAALLGKQVAVQATAVAFNSAFLSVSLFFLIAAPTLIISKVLIGKAIARYYRIHGAAQA